MTDTVNVAREDAHCRDDEAWNEFVRQYSGQPRSRPDLSDFELANAVFMADRYSLDLIHYQTAAKERIRWLSIELAKAKATLAAAPKAEPVWSETYIADEEDGPISGVLIDMLDGVQIWTGEASKALVDAAIAIDESPDQSGIYLMTGNPRQGTRIMASLARVEDGTEIARALAMKWSEASHTEAPKVEQEPDGYLTNVYATLVGCDWWEITKEPYELKSFEKVREVHALYRNPAPASDELLEAIDMDDFNIIEDWIESGENGSAPSGRVKGLWQSMHRVIAIAKHKGPQ